MCVTCCQSHVRRQIKMRKTYSSYRYQQQQPFSLSYSFVRPDNKRIIMITVPCMIHVVISGRLLSFWANGVRTVHHQCSKSDRLNISLNLLMRETHSKPKRPQATSSTQQYCFFHALLLHIQFKYVVYMKYNVLCNNTSRIFLLCYKNHLSVQSDGKRTLVCVRARARTNSVHIGYYERIHIQTDLQ